MPFLLKTEPDKYSYDDLVRDGETVWDGIKNPQAHGYLREMKKGERLVIYHSNVGKEAVGTATVVSVDATDQKNPLVRIKSGTKFTQPNPRGRGLRRLDPVPPVPAVSGAAHRSPVRLAGARVKHFHRVCEPVRSSRLRPRLSDRSTSDAPEGIARLRS